MAQDGESIIWSLALSLFCSYLGFASKSMRWLTQGEAEEIFLEVWQAVLPESAPGVEEGTPACEPEPITTEPITAKAFYAFLNGYLDRNRDRIIPDGERRGEDAVAALHRIGNVDWLILPRVFAFQEMCHEHPNLQIDTTERDWEAALQRALIDDGIPFHTEGKDISWRHPFYNAGHVPEGVQPKLPCLGIPVDQLPDSVLVTLKTVFGDVFGQTEQRNLPDAASEEEREEN